MKIYFYGFLFILGIFFNVFAKNNFEGIIWEIDTMTVNHLVKIKMSNFNGFTDYSIHNMILSYDFKNHLISDTLLDVKSTREVVKEEPKLFKILFKKDKFYCWYPEIKKYFISSYKVKKDFLKIEIFTGARKEISAKLNCENGKLIMKFDLDNETFKESYSLFFSPVLKNEEEITEQVLEKKYQKVKSTIFVDPSYGYPKYGKQLPD